MSSELFHLTSTWQVQAPAGSVFAVLADLGALSSWWPGMRSAWLVRSRDLVGRRARIEIFGLLPIAIRADIEITAAEPERRITVVSRGELAGSGEWRLREHAGTSSASFTWDVRLEHRWLSPRLTWLRPLLIQSHRFAMWRGERGLKRMLERQVSPCDLSATQK